MITVDIYFSDLKRGAQEALIDQFGDHIADNSEPIFSIARAERKDLDVAIMEGIIEKELDNPEIH